jgi:hypothetical protein
MRFFYETREPLVKFEIKNNYDFFDVKPRYGTNQTGEFHFTMNAKNEYFNQNKFLFNDNGLTVLGHSRDTVDGEKLDQSGNIIIRKFIDLSDSITPDFDYGKDGISSVNAKKDDDLPYLDTLGDAVQDASGNILLNGYFLDEERRTRPFVANTLADGSLNIDFAENGILTNITNQRTDICSNFIFNTFLRGVTIDNSGNSYHVGVVFNFADEINDGIIFKVDSSGNLDSSFGDQGNEDPSGTGVLFFDICGQKHLESDASNQEFFTRIDFNETDEKLYLGGYARINDENNDNRLRRYFMLQRRFTNGKIDTTFGNDAFTPGTSFIRVGRFKGTAEITQLNSLKLDDFIYLGGESEPYYELDPNNSKTHLTLTRLDYSGNVDPSFGMFPPSPIDFFEDFETDKSTIDYSKPRGIIYDIFPKYVRDKKHIPRANANLILTKHLFDLDSEKRIYATCSDLITSRNNYDIPIGFSNALLVRYTPDGRPDISFNPSPGLNESNYYYRAMFSSPREQYYCQTESFNVRVRENDIYLGGIQQKTHIKPFIWKVDISNGTSTRFTKPFTIPPTGNPSFTSLLKNNQLVQSGTMKYRDKSKSRFWSDDQTPYSVYPSLEGWFYQSNYDVEKNNLKRYTPQISREKRENDFTGLDIPVLAVERPIERILYWTPVDSRYNDELSRVYVLSFLSTTDPEWEEPNQCIGITASDLEGNLIHDFSNNAQGGFGVYQLDSLEGGSENSINPVSLESDASAIYVASTYQSGIHLSKIDHNGKQTLTKNVADNIRCDTMTREAETLYFAGVHDNTKIHLIKTDLSGTIVTSNNYSLTPSPFLIDPAVSNVHIANIGISGEVLYLSGNATSETNFLFSLPISLGSLELLSDISVNSTNLGIYHRFTPTALYRNSEEDVSDQIIFGSSAEIDDVLISGDHIYVLSHTRVKPSTTIVDKITDISGTIIETDFAEGYFENEILNAIVLARLNLSGSLDETFGNQDPSFNGVLYYDSFPSHFQTHLPRKLHIQGDTMFITGTIFDNEFPNNFIGKFSPQNEERITQQRLVPKKHFPPDQRQIIYNFNYHPPNLSKDS